MQNYQPNGQFGAQPGADAQHQASPAPAYHQVPRWSAGMQSSHPFSPVSQDDASHYSQVSGNSYFPVESAGGLGSWFEFSHPGYLKGFFIGAGATLILTNPSVQKALVRGAVKLWSFIQGGVEEVKEQFRDVNAEMSQEK